MKSASFCRRWWRCALAVLAAVQMIAPAGGAEPAAAAMPSTLLDRVGTEPGAVGAKYVLHVPRDYDPARRYPLVVFPWQPAYMRKDPEYLLQHDASFRQMFIVFPQARARSFWKDADAELVLAVVGDVRKHYEIDPARVYLTGLSMGGYGVWNLATRYPHVWAAIAPICGAGEPDMAEVIKDIPCWCWHGDEDDRVPVQHARDMIAALRAAGGTPKYTELPGVGHASYGPAFKSAEFWSSLLAQKLKSTPVPL